MTPQEARMISGLYYHRTGPLPRPEPLQNGVRTLLYIL